MNAIEIYDILVSECGALESDRKAFNQHFPFSEWRFQGLLGFGGKLYHRPDNTFYVDSYEEDLDDMRRAIINRTNKLLI